MIGIVAGLLLLSSASADVTAQVVVLDFEAFFNGEIITDQYPEVTFSSEPGSVVLVTRQPGIGFGDNFICTGAPPEAPLINCTDEVRIDFARPVNGLRFWSTGDNDVGVVGQVDVFTRGIFAASVDIDGFATFDEPHLVDLTKFEDVTRIVIYDVIDAAGLGFDNFTYQSDLVFSDGFEERSG